jgi:hypothetical protein
MQLVATAKLSSLRMQAAPLGIVSARSSRHREGLQAIDSKYMINTRKALIDRLAIE